MMMPQRQNQLPCATVGSPGQTRGNATSKVDHTATIADAGVTGTVTPTNDNSNPQQGSGCIGIVTTSKIDTATKDPAMDHHQEQDFKFPQKNIQQQREVSSGDMVISAAMTIPYPSISNNGFLKDARKLFVGGLPQDSE
jgi:hypothetical protein